MARLKFAVIFIAFLALLAAGAVLVYKFISPKEPKVFCVLDAKTCPDGSYVSRIAPSCEFALCPGEKEGILVSLPQKGGKINSPLKIEGEARGTWYFEAIFTAELFDGEGNLLGRAILQAKEDWMTENFVPFQGELSFSPPKTKSGTLKFLSANPSGLEEHQKVYEVGVNFGDMETRKVFLYYYNPDRDKDETGNIKCGRDGLEAVERNIPLSLTPIQDTIKLLIEGKLTGAESSSGLTTEYPIEDFKLLGADLDDGFLTLTFLDPLNKTSGGSCRAGILWFQIEKTALQFSEVKRARFMPEWLFQP